MAAFHKNRNISKTYFFLPKNFIIYILQIFLSKIIKKNRKCIKKFWKWKGGLNKIFQYVTQVLGPEAKLFEELVPEVLVS